MKADSVELLRKLHDIKYQMGTGSEEWWDIKTDFEELGEMSAVGAVSFYDAGNPLAEVELNERLHNLEELKKRVEEYRPVDSLEVEEKEKVLKKCELCLEMYDELLKTKE